MNSDRLNLAMVIFAALLLVATIMALPGCGVMRDIDKAIWEPPTSTVEELDRAEPPPLLEAAAGILAALGYGGFAVWIKRVKKNGNAQAVDLQHQIAELRADIANHKDNIHAPAALTPPYTPTLGVRDTTPDPN
ncbi:MAG TPA: hypothetical protein VM389_12940 [Phycisphaerae bacterium]|nr:hypothetical protein [Phycisphaerae bacterium]